MKKYLWILIYLGVLLWSAIKPHDYFTWFLEVFPALIGAFILLVTYNRFRLTPLLYQLILLHCIILMIGGHYTYAEVPFFDTLKEILNSQRNQYDKLGHLFQGIVPAIIAREILLRYNVVNGNRWLVFIVTCIVLAISAFYELIEWWVALATGESADAFLGTQGYVWDTQSDMGYALLGAIISLLTLSRLHDRQLQRINR